MGDLSDVNAAQSVKIIGSEANGVEKHAIGSVLDATGEGCLKVTHCPDTNTGGGSGPPCTSKKLRYDDMNASNGGINRDTNVGGSWTDVYSYAGSGLLHGWEVTLESEDKWEIRLLVDGEEVFGSNGIKLDDIMNDDLYGLKADDDLVTGHFGINLQMYKGKVFWTGPNNFPMCYKQSVVVKVRRPGGGKKFRAGLMVLTKES